VVQPQDFNLHAAPLDSIRVANADEARTMLLSVLDNQPCPARDIVQLNAGAAIYVAGLTATLQEGVKRPRKLLLAARRKISWKRLSIFIFETVENRFFGRVKIVFAERACSHSD